VADVAEAAAVAEDEERADVGAVLAVGLTADPRAAMKTWAS
jgi:hypothetical protein